MIKKKKKKSHNSLPTSGNRRIKSELCLIKARMGHYSKMLYELLMKTEKGKFSAQPDNMNHCERKHSKVFNFQWPYEVRSHFL